VSRTLNLGPGVTLPLETVTQAIAIIAKRRAGKSYTARRLVEQLHRVGQQIVIVDPKGDWWGLRSAADGKAPGLPVVILGGERGDVRLEAGAGEVVAKLAVEDRVSILLDLSQFRKHEVATFMTAFLETLYRLKAREQYRTPLMLVIDEADAIAPQRPQRGEERMLGAAEDIVRRGGQRGIGCTLITQRTAVLNKNVLTQAQVLVALRTIAPQDLKALEAWIDVHGTAEERAKLMEVLPSLPIGDAWFWSPGWPGAGGIFQRVHVARIETFDSGATPKPGEKRIEPKAAADVDLEALRRQMAATIERAKAEDPRELRKRIAELERQVAAAGKAKVSPAPVPKVQRVEVPVVSEAKLERLAKRVSQLHDAVGAMHKLVSTWDQFHRAKVATFVAKTGFTSTSSDEGEFRPFKMTVARPTQASGNGRDHGHRGQAEVGQGGLRRILTALAQRPQGLSASQIGVRAGLSSRSGTFSTYLGRARAAGWIEGTRGRMRVTGTGLAALGEYQALPEGRELLEHWLGELGDSGSARMLRVLAEAYPKQLSKAELAERAGLTGNSGTFSTYLGRLRALELIEGHGELRASEELFS
jgi:uncharacterized protein DUF87